MDPFAMAAVIDGLHVFATMHSCQMVLFKFVPKHAWLAENI